MIQDTSVDNTTTNRTASWSSRFSLRWLLLAAAFFFLWRLNYAPFWNPDEGRYASAAMEIATPIDGGKPDWIVPHLNTLPRLNKPPLVYWLAAVSFTLFGQSEWSGRLVSALAAIAVMLFVWRLARSMFGERAGVLCGLIWATSTFPFAMARTLNTDMLLCLATAVTLCGMWWAIGDSEQAEDTTPASQKPRPRVSAFVVAGIGMGLALLAKGPVGVALPLAIGFFYLCLARRWGAVRWAGVLLAVIIAIVIATPWYWAIEQREPGFLRHFIIGENLGRFSGEEEYHDPKGFWFYLPVLLLGLLPWAVFLPQAAARWQWQKTVSRPQRMVQWLLWSVAGLTTFYVLAKLLLLGAGATNRDLTLVNALAPLALLLSVLMRCRMRAEVANHLRGSLLFLWLWALVPVVLFSLSSTKLVTYVLLSFPAFAILLGQAVNSLSVPQWQSRVRNALSMMVMIVLNGVLGVAAVVFLAGNKTVPREVGLPWAVAGCAILLLSSLLYWWAWRGATPATILHRVVGSQLAGAVALFVFLISVAGMIAPYEDASQMIKSLRPHLRPGDLFVEFKTFQPTAIFYLKSPVHIIDFVNTSGLDEEEFNRSELFPQRMAVREMLNHDHRVYVLVRWNHVMMEVLRGTYTVGRNNDYHIVSNYPRPTDFKYDFTAPGKRDRPIPPDTELD